MYTEIEIEIIILNGTRQLKIKLTKEDNFLVQSWNTMDTKFITTKTKSKHKALDGHNLLK